MRPLGKRAGPPPPPPPRCSCLQLPRRRREKGESHMTGKDAERSLRRGFQGFIFPPFTTFLLQPNKKRVATNVFIRSSCLLLSSLCFLHPPFSHIYLEVDLNASRNGRRYLDTGEAMADQVRRCGEDAQKLAHERI